MAAGRWAAAASARPLLPGIPQPVQLQLSLSTQHAPACLPPAVPGHLGATAPGRGDQAQQRRHAAVHVRGRGSASSSLRCSPPPAAACGGRRSGVLERRGQPSAPVKFRRLGSFAGLARGMPSACGTSTASAPACWPASTRSPGSRQGPCCCCAGCQRAARARRLCPLGFPLPSQHATTHLHTCCCWLAPLQANSEVHSHPDDPLGLTTTKAASLRGCPPGATRPAVRSQLCVNGKACCAWHLRNTACPGLRQPALTAARPPRAATPPAAGRQ